MDDVADNMTQGCYMAMVYIASAYHSVSVNPSHWTFQGISWSLFHEHEYLMDTRLCFVLHCSPYLFTKIIYFVVATVVRLGYRCVINYLDDFLVFVTTYEECQDAQAMLITLLGQLGFFYILEKSVLNQPKLHSI